MEPAPAKATARAWVGLAVLVLPLLLITIDGTVLIMALPDISSELGPNGTEQLWMIDMYSLVLAGLLVAMSTVGERFGRRRNLLIGAVVFSVASVVGALSVSPWMLIGSRALLGIGGAMMMPSTLSLARNMFLDRQQRRYAMAVWGAMASVGAAAGPIIGGWVIETFTWHAAFLMNIPVMIVLLALGPFLLPESRNPALHGIDRISVALSFVGLIGITYGIKTLMGSDNLALGFVGIVIGLVAITLFVRRQLRLSTPLLDVRLFAIPYFRGAVITDLLSIFAMVGALLAMTQYLQLVLGLSPFHASIWLVPQAAVAAGAAFIAAILVKRFLPAYVITVGLVISAIGFAVTLFVTPTSPPVLISVILALVSLGAGLALSLSNDIIMSSVKPERAGQAAAVSETAYEIGTALGTAVLGSVLVGWYTRIVSAETGSLDLTPDLAERASSTVAEGLQVASEVGGTLGTLVADLSARAFTEALTVTGLAGAGLMVLAAAWALLTLRGAAAQQDLAAAHDDELS